MAKFIAQIILAGTQVLGRAFARALKQEIEASQDAARRLGNARSRAEGAANTKVGLSLDEARQILNVTSPEPSQDDVHKQYDALFKANERDNGGTIYLQSKIVRAKERFDMEFYAPPSQSPSTEGTSSEESTSTSQDASTKKT